jgi:hypothetical protein
MNFESTIDVTIECTDGRKGNIIMNLNQPSLMTGYGRGKLSDGTKIEVFLGNVSNEMFAPQFLEGKK